MLQMTTLNFSEQCVVCKLKPCPHLAFESGLMWIDHVHLYTHNSDQCGLTQFTYGAELTRIEWITCIRLLVIACTSADGIHVHQSG